MKAVLSFLCGLAALAALGCDGAAAGGPAADAAPDAALADGGPAGEGGPDAPAGDALVTRDGGWPDAIAALPEGALAAHVAASREVIREPAAEAPAADSETVLSPGTAAGVVFFRWEVSRSRDHEVVFTSPAREPVFACPAGGRGAYDVFLEVSDGATRSRFKHRRLVTCVPPRVPAGRPVFDVDLTQGSYFQEGTIGGTTVPPGALVRLSGSISANLAFFNFIGTASQPIHFINQGLVENRDASYLLHLINCQHVIVDGLGDDAYPYGFVLANTTTTGGQAVFLRTFTAGANVTTGLTDIELFGIHVVRNDAGSGLEVNTKGSESYNRTNFAFDDLRIHHVLVEDVALEGFYLGYTRDWVDATGPYPAYQLHDAAIYRNVIARTGWDGLQVANAVVGLEVHDNLVVGSALAGQAGQASSFQYNAGNSGHVYNNRFLDGPGADLQVGCTGGDSYFYNNVLDSTGGGFYVHAGASPGATYTFFNNVVRTATPLVRLNYTSAPTNCDPGGGPLTALHLVNNLVIIPTAQPLYQAVSGAPDESTWTLAPNLRRAPGETADLCFADEGGGDYHPACATSPALAGGGLDLETGLGLAPASLPLGLYTDADGRVVDHLDGFGAYQRR